MMPDKIYIFKDGDELWYKPEEWETPPPGRVEYIRKDALLEWLKERRAEHSFEVRKAYQRTIEKIESL